MAVENPPFLQGKPWEIIYLYSSGFSITMLDDQTVTSLHHQNSLSVNISILSTIINQPSVHNLLTVNAYFWPTILTINESTIYLINHTILTINSYLINHTILTTHINRLITHQRAHGPPPGCLAPSAGHDGIHRVCGEGFFVAGVGQGIYDLSWVVRRAASTKSG